MALTCSREFIKYLFYALDLLNLVSNHSHYYINKYIRTLCSQLFSIVLLAHTIVVLIQIRHMEEVRKIGLFVLMLSCLLSVVMSIVGFCGAKREVKYMLYTVCWLDYNIQNNISDFSNVTPVCDVYIYCTADPGNPKRNGNR